MIIKYTVIGKKLYNGLTGEEIATKGNNTNHLKLWRKERGWSQNEAAEILGISQQFISQIENYNRPLPEEILIKMN